MGPRRFSASIAGQLMACHGSANLELAIPGFVEPVKVEGAGAAGRGDVMHDILADAMLLKNRELQGLVTALEYVSELRKTRRFKMQIEEKVVAEWLPSKPHTTPDVVLYLQDELHIIDWKTGMIAVEAEDNPQQLFYACSVAHLAPKAKGVHIHIVQPWGKGSISYWYADMATLAQFMADAVAADEAILAGDTTLTPSDNCTFCPANPHSRGEKGRPFCPPMMELLYPSIVDVDEILAL